MSKSVLVFVGGGEMLGLYYHRLVVRVTFSENRSWFPQSISFCLFPSTAAGDVNCLKCGNLC